MSVLIPLAIGSGVLGLGAAAYGGLQLRRANREHYIRTFILPQGLYKKLQEKRSEVDPRHHPLIARALWKFFLCHLMSGRRFVSMPSQIVDDLWHEFILYTRNYQQFYTKRNTKCVTVCGTFQLTSESWASSICVWTTRRTGG